MTPFAILDQFRAFTAALADETFRMAAEGGDEWDDYMTAHGLEPGTGEERAEIRALHEPPLEGTLPAEVRSLLEKQREAAILKGLEFKQQFGSQEWWMMRVETPMLKLLENYVPDHVKKYIGEMKPKVVSSGTLFANALTDTPKYFTDVSGAGTQSEKCPTCMAARPAGTELKKCAFCGTEIFKA